MGWWERIWGIFQPTSAGQKAWETPAGILESFQAKISYRFRDISLLRTALTHRSYLRTTDSAEHISNERLEFLGDSVLGLVVADHLYQKFPQTLEGGLTKHKALLVNESTLFRTAEALEMGNYLILSPEEERAGGRRRTSINADAFEAVLGAIYLDGGLNAARRFVHRYLVPQMERVTTDDNLRNFKGDLLEHLQAGGAGIPRYEVTSEEGPDHEKIFTVVVFTNGEQIGTGVGSTKKDAEQRAAAQALLRLRGVEANNHQG